MKRMILAALLLAAPLVAQQQKDEKITKMLHLQFTEPRAIVNLISSYNVQIQFNDSMKVMMLNGLPANVAAAEAAIKQLDVAPKTVELTVYFVVGGDNAAQMAGTPVPADVRDVITQLKGVFTFKEYKMLDVLTLRTRTGSDADTSGILNSGNPPRMSQFSIRNVTVGDDGSIRIDRMHAGLRIPFSRASEPGKSDYINSGIDQNVDLKEGQKVVVGRSSLEGPEKALFLILTARVVQ
ncbi:MAG TPA: hypothetical protein VGF49_22660 [Candidatus Solibacter sp.]|jgi:hypothetical protein